MNRREFLSIAGAARVSAAAPAERKPNVVIIFLDDSGWSDFHPFGNPPYPTPNVAQLANQGTSFHRFYVPQAVCSASRSALMTGCYPERTKLFGAHPPRARGLDPSFATMGQVFKNAGYRTAVFGKWHLGDQPETRPPARGFDESCGLMYSNDMWEYHPERPQAFSKFPLQFWENGEVKIERVTPEHQPFLTRWYTEHAVDFIRRNGKNPFLLYVPHSMPHVPLFCSDKFRGKSKAGLYGDVMMEIDWSVGEITKALGRAGVEKDTIIIFTSDNGPWLSYGNHAGKTPYRESKSTGFDGGTRSACIVRYPGSVPAGRVSRDTFCSIDLLPTLVAQIGAKLPENPIDGKDVWDLITGKADARNPHEYYAFSTAARFNAVMSGDGRWKLHVPHPYNTVIEPGNDGKAGKLRTAQIDTSLFHLESDAMESVDVSGRFPEVLARMQGFADEHRRRFWST